MDFALLPPEVNSGRMYSGPGAAPMLAAAAAWDALAADLETAAAGYSAALSGLIGYAWSGPASVAMANAAAPYVAWLQAGGTKAAQVAMQAKTAAAAYETAFAATVPPAAVAANRVLLATLVATNFFGQNTAAIAATEAQYAEMWAQDAAAMYGYAAASASASALPQFDRAPQTVNPAASTATTASMGSSATSSATTSAMSSALTSAPTSGVSALGTALNSVSPFTSVAASGISFDSSAYTVSTNGAGWGRLLFVRGGVEGALTFEGLGPRQVLSAATRPVAGPVAGVGRATPIGELSVPPSWVSAAPEVRAASVTLAAAETGMPAAVGLPPGTVFGEAMMGTTAGQGAQADPTSRRGQQSGEKNDDQDGQRVTSLTNGNGWLASSWAYHNRRREAPPLPSHWRTG